MHKGFTSRMAPDGFIAAGCVQKPSNFCKTNRASLLVTHALTFQSFSVINGVCVCYKTVDIANGNSSSQSYVNIK